MIFVFLIECCFCNFIATGSSLLQVSGSMWIDITVRECAGTCGYNGCRRIGSLSGMDGIGQTVIKTTKQQKG